ncbi:DUF6301 family protein [Actinomyces bowdenii]|uniref:DUF6301 family protein n=1 Tax=Actinomyces bowdenii TaxID=131109 RepID=UPI003C7BB0EB
MSKFRALPVDEAVTWIRAWTDHTWPITLQQAFAIRDRLEWVPSPHEPRFFTTKLSLNRRENGRISRSNEFGITGVNFSLSSTPSSEEIEQKKIAHAAYSHYINALQNLWGPGTTYGKSHFRWVLSNKVSISIILTGTRIGVKIESPWLTQVTEEYDRAMEDYE